MDFQNTDSIAEELALLKSNLEMMESGVFLSKDERAVLQQDNMKIVCYVLTYLVLKGR